MKIKMCSYCGKVFGDFEEYGYEHCWECGEKNTISEVEVYTKAELDEAVKEEKIEAYRDSLNIILTRHIINQVSIIREKIKEIEMSESELYTKYEYDSAIDATRKEERERFIEIVRREFININDQRFLIKATERWRNHEACKLHREEGLQVLDRCRACP